MYKRNFCAILFGIVIIRAAAAAECASFYKFSDYPVAIYTKQLRIPPCYVKTGDVWRDDMNKRVEAPHINFAGKYYVGLHSCGAECRYYTLSDLESGRDSHAIDIFSSGGDGPTKTMEGRAYVTELVSRPDSNLLLVQYHIDAMGGLTNECRQRTFLLNDDGESVRPITNMIESCCVS
jgi:hypothetical protein